MIVPKPRCWNGRAMITRISPWCLLQASPESSRAPLATITPPWTATMRMSSPVSTRRSLLATTFRSVTSNFRYFRSSSGRAP